MRVIKSIMLTLALSAALLCLAACNDDPASSEAVYYDVTFNSAGGTEIESLRVLEGTVISKPSDPVKEGYIFDGWLNGNEKWNFESNKVTSNLTLTASWINSKSIFEYTSADGKITLTKYKGSLKSLKIPEVIDGYPVVALGDSVFKGEEADDLLELTVGKNITSIGNSAFYECVGTSIVIEGKLESVGEKAFFGCDGLKKVEFASGIAEIPFEAFSGCTSLETVILSDTVSAIGENAFKNCAKLELLIIHPSLKKISDSAFLNCSSLKSIYYYGSAEEWALTEIAEGNEGNTAVIEATLYLYSKQEPEAVGKYWYFDKKGNVRIW